MKNHVIFYIILLFDKMFYIFENIVLKKIQIICNIKMQRL